MADMKRTMHPRLRLDLGWSDVLHGLAASATARDRDRRARALESGWSPRGDALACLSVRSGFDLLLSALALPPGSEVLFSAITISDMPRIARHHGLVPVPVDLDLETLSPQVDRAAAAITPRTRVLVVAHLFGRRVDLAAFLPLARRHELVLVEDCAQGFRDPADSGHPEAAASFFSFGTIKSATALGGALVRVRQPSVLARMRALESTWPVQPRSAYFQRVAKYGLLHAVSHPSLYALLARGCEAQGTTLDAVIGGAVRGFPVQQGGGPLDDDAITAALLTKIRHRASATLLAMLRRRLTRFDGRRLAARARSGDELARLLPAGAFQPGGAAPGGSHWVFPVLVARPDVLIAALSRAGFDASKATSSLFAVAPPPDRPDLAPHEARRLIEHVVFAPAYPELSNRERLRLARVVTEALPEAGPFSPTIAKKDAA